MNPDPSSSCAICLVETSAEAQAARLLLHSLRFFGGLLRSIPVWIFYPPELALVNHPDPFPGLQPVQLIPLQPDPGGGDYPFASKVRACAQAEVLAEAQVRSLVWLNPGCLVVKPPVLFDLDPGCDAAFRPVHHTNIGLPAQAPLDDYWGAVYGAVGLNEAPFTVESFADAQILRPYFNTHCFAINPKLGLFAAWQEHFQALVNDPAFHSGPCRGPLRRIFLHQAVLSALVAKRLERERLRLLPPQYSYPLHLHPQVPAGRQPGLLNELVCPVYEDAFEFPATLNGLKVEEPLRSWLREHSG